MQVQGREGLVSVWCGVAAAAQRSVQARARQNWGQSGRYVQVCGKAGMKPIQGKRRAVVAKYKETMCAAEKVNAKK